MYRFRRIAIIVFIQYVFVLAGQCQPASLYFRNLSIASGLPSNTVNSVVQDSSGFIWIGTEEGLCRYDAYSMQYFKYSGHQTSIPSNRISCLFLDGDLLWVGTWNGICTINTHTFEINTIDIGANKVIRAIQNSGKEQIWIGTGSGLICYNKSSGDYKLFTARNSGLSHNTIRCFYKAKSGDIWIGTFDKLNHYKNGIFKSFDLKGNYKSLIKNNLVLDISPCPGNNKLLWVGTETGLCLFDTETGKYETYNSTNTRLSNEVIKCIYPEGDLLWLGTDYGLNVLNVKTRETKAFYHNPVINHSISNNVIWDIFQDANNIMWFITSNGISLLNIRAEFYKTHEVFYQDNNEQAGNQVRDMLISSGNIFWMATIHGVVRRNMETGEQQNFTVDSPGKSSILLDNVYCLNQDRKKRIWMGTAGGINVWDDRHAKMYTITADESNGLQSNYISGVYFADDGTLFVSAWEGGVYRVDGDLDEIRNLKFQQITNDGEAMGLALKNNLYFMSRNNLYLLAPKNKTPIQIVKDSRFNTVIHCLNKDAWGNIWLGGDGRLFKYNPEADSLETYSMVDGKQKIISLEIDNWGIIWGAGSEQVFRFDPQTRKSILMPLNPNSPVKNFYTASGLQDQNGKIYFGGNNGYVEIDSYQRNFAREKVSTYISGIRLNNEPVYYQKGSNLLTRDIAFTNKLKLKYAENTVMLDFSTLDFWMPEKNIYRYRLLNYNEDWQVTEGEKNFALYSNLAPGKYTFEVAGANHNGLWDTSPVCLSIKVSPPLWLGKIFLFIYLLLITGIIYGVLRFLNYRHRIANQLKMAQLEKKHSEKLLQAKQQFFTNISHEFRTPLSLIVPPLQQMVTADNLNDVQKRMLTLAGRNSQRLLRLVNQILDFRKLENTKLKLTLSKFELVAFCQNIYQSFTDMARRNEINYSFKTEIASCVVVFDEEKIETILYNLLSNAFKHTPEQGKITIALNKSNTAEHIEIAVSDSGRGIPEKEQENIFKRFYQTDNFDLPKAGTGIGLTMAREYASLHNGTIEVKSRSGKGSVFTLSLPLAFTTEESVFEIKPFSFSEEKALTVKKEKPSSAQKTVLIIDDNPDILEYIELNLGMHYNLVRAGNGKEGLKKVKEKKPDLVISDVMMPVMNGLELCQKLKKQPQTAAVPVILLTAKTLDAQKTEGMMTGADLYITKPFNIAYLYSCIESLFRRENILQNYIKNELLIQPPNPNASDDDQNHIFIRRVMAVIEKNIDNNNLSVNFISREIGISSTHLYRKLMAITSQSTKDIIKNYRLKKAAGMLRNNEGNVTEIMYAVGFSSISSFSKSFKSVYGCPPGEYARMRSRE